jgi:hypothetical protein
MPNTFTLIASSTVGSGGTANIDFTSIPATYTDLCVKLSTQNMGVGFPTLRLRFNSDTSSVYSARTLNGDGASATSTNPTGTWLEINRTNPNGSIFTNTEIYIPNYTSTTTAKSLSADAAIEANATTAYLGLIAGLWNPGTQAAINSIGFFLSANNFQQYSTAYLYGIVKS